MKKLLCFLTVLGLVVGLAGCGLMVSSSSGVQPSASEQKTYLYFLNEDEDRLSWVEYHFNEPDTEGRVVEMIALQSQKPKNKKDVLLLPDGVKIQDYKLSDQALTLDLSAGFDDQTQTRKTLCIGGLVRSFVQIDGVDKILFTVDGRDLTDSSGNAVGALTDDSFVDNAGKNINAYQEMEMTLYFTDQTGSKLIPETRKVYYSSNEPVEKAVVEELIQGPSEEGHYPVFSTDTQVLSVISQAGICYVNFDDSVQKTILSISEEIPIYAIVNSLSDTCHTKKVQFSIDGESDTVFRNSMDLSVQYTRNDDLIAS
ncbi:MAG: GerMN domain-containing protein [Bilifractor sp.]|nr:GerMN domain-containing protein [Lachnospiraceae bacterium]MDY2837126.1 GerMN domain-containing protein [Bilifractor sp.]